MNSKQIHRKYHSNYYLANWFDDKGELVISPASMFNSDKLVIVFKN